MQYANRNIIEFIGNLILTYPDRFVINIYCKTKEAVDYFTNRFIDFFYDTNTIKAEKQDIVQFVNNNKELNIFKTIETINARGKRCSFALIEDKFSIEVIDNLIKPMCNLPVHLPSVFFAISDINEDNAVYLLKY